MRLLHSKHQKLILQCYPPGKGVDKRANPLELSYLLYYATTRRVKLEKVIEYLKHKTKNDVRGHKSGNLAVTLVIISALIEKCYDNLNVFAPQVCSILSLILTTKELPICKLLISTYGIFCDKLDNGLFSGDKEFVSLFSNLTSKMVSLTESQLVLEAANRKEWKLLSLMTCRHAFKCLGYNALLNQKLISKSVGLLAECIAESMSYEQLSSQLKSNLHMDYDAEKGLSRVVTSKSTRQGNKVPEDSEIELVSDDDLCAEALAGLKTLFDTSLVTQISEGTIAVVQIDYNALTKENLHPEWGITLLETCASYIPVQLRFQTLMTLIDKLSSTADLNIPDDQKFKTMSHFSKFTSGLISSDFSMIGLSISDILLQLLNLHTNLYLKVESEPRLKELSSIYSQCICNLASHIYYFDQIPDSIEGILLQIDSVLLLANRENCHKTYLITMDMLGMISKILSLLAEKSSTISRNHATLENWDISLQILNFGKAYPQFFTLAPHEEVKSIQERFLDVFEKFLVEEFPTENNLSEQNKSTNSKYSKTLTPNYHDFIDNKESVLNRLLLIANSYYQDATFDDNVARLLAKVLESVAHTTGVNFAYVFLAQLDYWQLQKIDRSPASIAKDQAAYLLLTTMISVLNNDYREILEEDILELSLAKSVKSDIDRRQLCGVWNGTCDEEMFKEILTSQLNRKSLHEYFSDTPLKQWINASKATNIENEIALSGHNRKFVPEDSGSDHQYTISAPGAFGLGKANDITSIYSRLNNGNGNQLGSLHSNATQESLTAPYGLRASSSFQSFDPVQKLTVMPRVEDLKLSIKRLDAAADSSFARSAELHPRTVIEKQIHNTEVVSILDDLDSDDDSRIIA